MTEQPKPIIPLSEGDRDGNTHTQPPPSKKLVIEKSTEKSALTEPLDPKKQRFLRLLPLEILAIVAIIWGFVGKIPIEVQGRSVLIIPSSILELQSRAAGKVATILSKPKDRVIKGQLLATLDLPVLQAQLRTEQQKLDELNAENLVVTNVQNQRSQLKRETIQRQGEVIPREVKSLKRQIDSNNEQIKSNKIQIDANQRQRQAYQQRITQLKLINQLISEKLDAYQKVVKEGVMAPLSGDLIRAVQAEQENRNTITSLIAQVEDNQAEDEKLKAQIKGLKAQNEDIRSKILNQNASSADLKTQNQQLDLENTEDNISRRNAITDQQRAITRLKSQIATDRNILSPYDGKILDISVNPSQYIVAGTRLGTIQVSDRADELIGLTFFNPGDADRLQVGMTIEITPDIHQRERYGGIVGTITFISPETITLQEVTKLVGNDQLAQSLTKNQPLVQIMVKLQRDPTTVSGYRWTQRKGAPQKIPESATATARVVVEERSLFSYLIPVLRGITGIYPK